MKKSSKVKSSPVSISSNPPSVTVEKAGNGFIISSYGDKGTRRTAIAADHKQMVTCMKKMMK